MSVRCPWHVYEGKHLVGRFQFEDDAEAFIAHATRPLQLTNDRGSTR
jgi:hypothetical protein